MKVKNIRRQWKVRETISPHSLCLCPSVSGKDGRKRSGLIGVYVLAHVKHHSISAQCGAWEGWDNSFHISICVLKREVHGYSVAQSAPVGAVPNPVDISVCAPPDFFRVKKKKKKEETRSGLLYCCSVWYQFMT